MSLTSQELTLDRHKRSAETTGWISLWERIANSRPRAWLVFLCLYIGPTVVLARQKLFWDDEFFTLYLSTSRNWSDLMAALSTGADQHPPSFYWLTHLVLGAFGTSSVTLRLTSIVGFAVMCGCLYEVVGRQLNREWGFCVMILPLACPYYYYAVEARGYGLEIAFAGLALLAWMLAAEGRSRMWTIPLLAISVCGAVASHYYAMLLVLALGAGELTRTISRRRVDWPVWLAFGASVLPVLAFSKVIAAAHTYAAHFWAIPHWRAMAGWYRDALGCTLALPLALGALALLPLFPPAARPFSPKPIKLWTAIAVLALAILPVVAVVSAKFITNAFTDRYAIAAFPGVCILLTIALSRILREARGAAAAIWLVMVVLFAGMAFRQSLREREELSNIQETAAFLRANSAGAPVVMSDLTRFHRLSFYARRDLGSRLVLLADPEKSIRYMSTDTVDRGLLDLNPWFPLNVRWFHEWIAEHPSFLVWASIGDWSWIPNGVADLGALASLKAVLKECVLMSVTATQPPPGGRRVGDPSGRPMRYSHTPTDGLPMCRSYMAAGSCPVVD
jgi:dolichyl-phosphate-mannose-protein mannosyltransferase